MKSYRLTFSLRSASGSAWQADTIFGHLCWLLLWRYGEDKLQDWLARYQANDPPLVLSDGFPGDLLPRPLLLPPVQARPSTKQEGVSLAENRKQLKKIEWLTLAEFERVRAGEIFEPSPEGDEARANLAKQRVTFKNQISRLTGTTGEEGQLYPFVERPWHKVTIYLHIAANDVGVVRQLFEDMKVTGYGKRKSVGYGEIVDGDFQEFAGFQPIPGANAFVSLSHFVPAQNDPLDGQWKVNVKYGKLGGEWASSPQPFKRPLLMLAAGSWFHTPEPERRWYGRMAPNVSQAHANMVQYGLAFAVPMRVSQTVG